MAAPPRHHRALSYSAKEWKWFDSRVIDATDAEQVALVAGLLGVNVSRIYAARRRLAVRGRTSGAG